MFIIETLTKIKEYFQNWYLIQRDKYLKKEISKIPSDNIDDYYFDNLTNQFVSKDVQANVQIGFHNILNVIKTKIEQLQINTENLEVIIDDIAQMNVATTNLQAIIGNINNLQAIIANIANIDINASNLQSIIADIANIETLNTTISGNITSLTAIIANINTMNTNITNLQAIIADIANIESLNTTISGNITSLTAIIANIGNMNLNISNLQAIISDIANIETQNIAMNSALATINTNIGTINTAITNINAHQADIDINIKSINDLDIEIDTQANKGIIKEDFLDNGIIDTQIQDSDTILYNRLAFSAYNTENNNIIYINIKIYNKLSAGWFLLDENDYIGTDGVLPTELFIFPTNPHLKIEIKNNGGETFYFKSILFFSKKLTKLSELSELVIPSSKKLIFEGLAPSESLEIYDEGVIGGHKIIEQFVDGGLKIRGFEWISLGTTNGGLLDYLLLVYPTQILLDVPINMNNANKIINVINPTNDQDVATKKYVDDNSSISLEVLNPASYHILVGQWSTIGSWTEYDLSAHIPAMEGKNGLVCISGKARGTSTGDELNVRSSAQTSAYACQRWISNVANLISDCIWIVPFYDGKIDYFRGTNIDYIQLTVVWFIEI